MRRQLKAATIVLAMLAVTAARASIYTYGFNQPIIADGKAYAIPISDAPEVVAVDIGEGAVLWRTPLPEGCYRLLYHGAPGEIVASGYETMVVLDRNTGRIKKSMLATGDVCGVSSNSHVFTVDWNQTTVRCYSYATGKPIWQTSLAPSTNPINADVRGNVVLVTIAPRAYCGDEAIGLNLLVCLTADTGELVWKKALSPGADGWADDVHVDDSATRVVAYHHRDLWVIDGNTGRQTGGKSFEQMIDVARFWRNDRLIVGYRSADKTQATLDILTLPDMKVADTIELVGTNKYDFSWGVFGDVLDWGHCLVNLKNHKEQQVPVLFPDYGIQFCCPPIRDMKVYFGSGRPGKQTRLLATHDIMTGQCEVFFEELCRGAPRQQMSGHSEDRNDDEMIEKGEPSPRPSRRP